MIVVVSLIFFLTIQQHFWQVKIVMFQLDWFSMTLIKYLKSIYSSWDMSWNLMRIISFRKDFKRSTRNGWRNYKFRNGEEEHRCLLLLHVAHLLVFRAEKINLLIPKLSSSSSFIFPHFLHSFADKHRKHQTSSRMEKLCLLILIFPHSSPLRFAYALFTRWRRRRRRLELYKIRRQ